MTSKRGTVAPNLAGSPGSIRHLKVGFGDHSLYQRQTMALQGENDFLVLEVTAIYFHSLTRHSMTVIKHPYLIESRFRIATSPYLERIVTCPSPLPHSLKQDTELV